jgi:SAM-dependent methyltransferase
MSPISEASVRASIDRAVRSSWLGRRSVWLRKASPRLYASLRSAYRRVVDRGSGDLSPYQARALEEFLSETPQAMLAVGVLEIGSDKSAVVLRELVARGATRVVGINPILDIETIERIDAELGPAARANAVDLLSAKLDAESFGAIMSIAVLEHMVDLDACLAEMYRLLVPGGRVYAAFGPIWSSSLGHHVFADVGGVQLRHWDPRLNPIPDHGHLLMTRDEMLAYVAPQRDEAVALAAVQWIYEEDDLNRLFYEDYVDAFERSPFAIERLTAERESVPSRRLSRLQAAHPGRTVFDVRNAVAVLSKPRGG